MPVPVAARSKAWVCDRTPAEIVGSNPTGGMDVCCECCVFSGRRLCDELITRTRESYQPWCVVVCDLETSIMRRPWPTGDCRTKNKQTFFLNNQPDAQIIQFYSVIKFYTFRASSLPIIRSFLLYVWLPSRIRMELQFHPDSAWKRSSKACMKLTSAECTVENS